MKIKDRLSLQFTLIFAALLFFVLASTYYLSEKNREQNFYIHLKERAFTVAQMFLAQDNLTPAKFNEVQKKYLHSLPGEELKIYNERGESVFINQNEPTWPYKKIQEVIKAKEVFFYDKGRQVAGIYYIDNSGNFIVFAAAEDIYEYRHMHQLLLIMLFVFIISLIIVFFLGQLFSSIALLPINRIINEIKFIRSTSLNKRLNTGNGKDEIAELSVTVNNLLEHLEQSFNAQSSFAANASHELRTPLTTVIGQIEVTLKSEREADEYKKVLKTLLIETNKINELINNLFELVNTNIDTDDLNDIRLDELMWQLKDEWENKLPGSSIDLEFSLPHNTAKYTTEGNWLLLFIAIGNIIKNAIKFSGQQPVACRVWCEDNMAIISIKDKGIGIRQEELTSIFQPFYRGSNTIGFEGMGVGLSLSEKILKLHNATIQVVSEINGGATFIIRFRIK
jgi:signal transduction histidine kinase